MKNKKFLDQILTVLYELQELGFPRFEFNENIDFTNKEYEVSKNMSLHTFVTVYDNMELIPTYDRETTMYKTNESSYQITLYFARGKYICNERPTCNATRYSSA
jgi:hypothetical protein